MTKYWPDIIANPDNLRPFVIADMGQSNAPGSDEAGSKTIEANIHIGNGSAMIPAAFGTAPLNGGNSGLGYNNCSAIHFANTIRRSGLIPSWRPIWIVPSWWPGESIARWVNEDSPDYFAIFEASLATYGVEVIDVVRWIQGEADSTTAETGYNTFDLYKTGFDALKVRLRALAEMPASTPIICQQLGLWRENTSQARNDYWQFVELGDDPYVAVSSAAGLTKGTGGSDEAHFSGGSLVTMGQRSAAIYLNMAQGKSQNAGLKTEDGFAVARLNTLTATGTNGGSAAELSVNVGDILNGAEIAAHYANITLPNASYTPGAELVVNVHSVTYGNTVLTSAQSIGDVPWQTDATSVTFAQTGIYVFKAIRDRWRFVSMNNFDYGLRQGGTITATTLTAVQCAGYSYIAEAGAYVLPNSNSVAVGRRVALRTNGIITLDCASGAIYTGAGAPNFAGTSVTIPANQVIILQPGENSRWYIIGGTWRPVRTHLTARTTDLTLTRNETGNAYTNEGATALVIFSLPACEAGLIYRFSVMDTDGIRVLASAASGDAVRDAATAGGSGSYIQSTTIGDTITLEGQNSTTWLVVAKNGAGWAIT